MTIILALKIVKLRKVKQDRRFVALAIPYTIYSGTKNENRDFIQQNHVFDSLGEDLGHDMTSHDMPMAPMAELPGGTQVTMANARFVTLRSADGPIPRSTAPAPLLKPCPRHERHWHCAA